LKTRQDVTIYIQRATKGLMGWNANFQIGARIWTGWVLRKTFYFNSLEIHKKKNMLDNEFWEI
jgi:hypothetical protein